MFIAFAEPLGRPSIIRRSKTVQGRAQKKPSEPERERLCVLLSKTDDGEVQRCRGLERRDEEGGLKSQSIVRLHATTFFFYDALELIMRQRV